MAWWGKKEWTICPYNNYVGVKKFQLNPPHNVMVEELSTRMSA